MSVSITAPPTINPNVLMEILGANETVQARIKQYVDAKASAEEALANLKIGADAKAAYAIADAKSTEAAQVLADAQKQAGQALDALSDANTKANVIITGAQNEAAKVAADTETKRAAHEQWLANTQADLKNKQDALVAERAAFDRVIAEHRQTVENAEMMKANAEAAIAKAAEAEASSRTLADALQHTLNALSK